MVSPAYLHGPPLNTTQKIILVVLAFVLPPLPVLLLTAPNYTFTLEFFVLVVLTLLGHVPGVLYTVWFLLFELKHPEGYIRIDEEAPQPRPLGITRASEQAGEQAHASQAEPPKYDDVVPFGDVKAPGDHKVQH